MHSSIIPVSLMEEEKEFLGILSIRQILIMGPALFLIYLWMTAVPLPFQTMTMILLIKLLTSVLFGLIASMLSFYYVEKYEMFLDRFLWIAICYTLSPKDYFYLD